MVVFSWAFSSRLERSKTWYLTAATIAITTIIVSFLFSAYLLWIVVILFSGVYLLYDISSHGMTHVEVGDDWVRIEWDLFPYKQIQRFGIIRVDGKPLMLRLETTSKSIGTLDIFLDPSLDTDTLRVYLLEFIPENPDAKISVIDHLLLWLRL